LAIHTVREYLQARILQSLQRAGAMQTLAFHGGTSLRFLYDIPRYSEDLDFALELHPQTYDWGKLSKGSPPISAGTVSSR
jgi:predicted nucleotidyltransferase component of viral defense system